MLTSTNKRKRIAQACKQCGNRKVKCDGVTPGCSRCVADGVECFYPVSKRNRWISNPAVRATPSTPSAPSSEAPSSVPASLPASLPASEISSNLRGQLFRTYFRCIHPIWPVLYKPLYDTLNHTELMEVLPIPLINAIFSIAFPLLDPDSHGTHSTNDQAHHFFLEALRLLKEHGVPQRSQSIFAMKPTIIHCQVLTILALQQHGIAAFSQAGTLCAVAVSMAIDLQLHIKSVTDTYIEAQTKSRVWWTVYVLEKMLSCEMSRPTLLRFEESDTPFPSVEESDEYEFFSEVSQTNNDKPRSLKLRTISAFHTSIQIAMLMEKVSRQIYSIGARTKIREDRIFGEETRLRIWAQLKDYEQALESSPLKLDISGQGPVLPVTVTNYVYLWLTTILLHRPFIEHWQQDRGSDELSLVHEDPYRICCVAADHICSTLQKHSELIKSLPCDLVFPIFVAGNVLLRRWRQSRRQDISIQQSLEMCVRWLNALGKSWKSAKARRQVLAESMETITPPNEQERSLPSWQALNLAIEGWVSEEDFALDYMQWISGVDVPSFLE
ncbi:hypothetical protein WAI453_000122 [Rhynchosporium graminicola]